MAAYNVTNSFAENLAEGVHDLDTHTLEVALTPAASAPIATNTILANLTEIVYTNLSARAIALTASGHVTGTYKLELNNLVLTATGAVQTFRYVAIFNQSTAVLVDPLMGWYDHGSDVTLANGETFTVDFSDANGFFQLA